MSRVNRMANANRAEPMSRRTLRVLLLEDNPADAELLTQQLDRTGVPVVAKRVDSAESFAAALDEFAPDVVLSDHGLPQLDAVAAVNVLRGRRPGVPLIVVSGALDLATAVECFRAGVDDVVSKGDLRGLRVAITAALAVREPLRKLSPRQLEVLAHVAAGFSTRQIAQRLGLSAKTVETHRTAIMKRLGVHDVVTLVRYALRCGVVWPPTADNR